MLFFSSPAFAGDEAASALSNEQLILLSQDRQWHKLLHFKKTWLGVYRSETSDPYFFVTKTGSRDPQAELKAFAAALDAEKVAILRGELPSDKWVGCRFPARRAWLATKVPAYATEWKCESFETYRRNTRAQSATLVFSSFYLNNPSSTFGHTFLRVNRESQGPRSELLDYGFNFAAVATTQNPVLFALYGLMGGFHGAFTSIPYYYKVQEYNDHESRDIWEYDLNLSKEEIDMVVAHFWEVGQVAFPYYYLFENCSYHMFTVLEAAAPRLRLTEKLPRWIIPTDTVQVLFEEPGLVGDIRFRPSKRRLFDFHFGLLSENEKSQWHEFVDRVETSKALTDFSVSTSVADSAIDYFDYKYFRDIHMAKDGRDNQKRELLSYRSRLPVQTRPAVPTPEIERIELGHASNRLGLSIIGGQSGNGVGVSQRFALHDLLDSHQGYPRDAEIQFLSIEASLLRKDSEQRFAVDRFYPMKVKSFSPYSPITKDMSWQGGLGIEPAYDMQGESSRDFGFSGGLGYTLGLGSSFFASGLVNARAMYSHDREGSVFAGIGPEIVLRFSPAAKVKALWSGELQKSLIKPYPHYFRSVFEARLSLGSRWSLFAQAETLFPRLQTQLGIHRFF